MNAQPKALKNLLAKTRYAGIYHLPHSGQAALEQAAGELGFACLKADLEDADEMGVVLKRLGQQLDFPEWFGANLDALSDCLTDLSGKEAPGYVITLSGADTLHGNAEHFSALNEVFADASQHWKDQGVPFWIFYDLRADGLATLPTLA